MIHGLFIEVNIENGIFPGNVNDDNNPARLKQFTITVTGLKSQIPIPKFQIISKF